MQGCPGNETDLGQSLNPKWSGIRSGQAWMAGPSPAKTWMGPFA
ncbi:hypothetical protein SAMN05444161_4373 [Rhizobiales bacterium GAS191]|nr:hypothetical protein SAMN05444161_4373 [Rhizobiales bacterium GAS191]SEE55446.1 hypothetical protein SAMN05519104_6500 [Rhizobiales bacterium GAS188]